jgi:hypothetical protein
MPPSPTPGSPTSLCSRTSMPTWPSPFDHRLGTPDIPAIRFAREADFVASLVRFRYGLPGCSPPLYGSDWNVQPSGTFTSRLPTDRSPSPLLDMTTTVTGFLLLAGLSPAGMAASFAARSKPAYQVRRSHVSFRRKRTWSAREHRCSERTFRWTPAPASANGPACDFEPHPAHSTTFLRAPCLEGLKAG